MSMVEGLSMPLGLGKSLPFYPLHRLLRHCQLTRPRASAIDGCAFEQSTLIQCTIGTGPGASMSSTECLNLNITVPFLASVADTVFPVMVFIHGGGFIMGANSWPQYDPARLVRMSADLGSPLIVVNVNYRLGGPGNLTSEELRNAGYPG